MKSSLRRQATDDKLQPLVSDNPAKALPSLKKVPLPVCPFNKVQLSPSKEKVNKRPRNYQTVTADADISGYALHQSVAQKSSRAVITNRSRTALDNYNSVTVKKKKWQLQKYDSNSYNFLKLYTPCVVRASRDENVTKKAYNLMRSFQTPQPRFDQCYQDRPNDNSVCDAVKEESTNQVSKSERSVTPSSVVRSLRKQYQEKVASKYYQQQVNQLKNPNKGAERFHKNKLFDSRSVSPSFRILVRQSKSPLMSRSRLHTQRQESPDLKDQELSFSPNANLTDQEILMLYHAKCNDLQISELDGQKDKFIKNCAKNSVNRTLRLQSFNVGPCTAQIVAQIMVENLHFCHYQLAENFMGDPGVELISQAMSLCNHIVTLDLSSNNLTHEGILPLCEVLSSNQSLVSLNLSSSSMEGRNRNRLHAQGALLLRDLLIKNPVLQHLNVSGTNIKNEGVKQLCEGVKQSQSLISLDISQNELTAQSCEYLRSMLSNSNLLKLVAKQSNFGDAGIERLVQALFFSRSKLMQLNLSDCNIEHQGLLKIFDATKQNHQLKSLILDSNKGNWGSSFAVLSKMVAENRCLESLSLSNCKLEDNFAIALGDGLMYNSKLKHINLSSNKLGDDGIKIVAFAIATKSVIQELNLSRNMIQEAGGLALCEMINKNDTLVKCNLSYNLLKDTMGQAMTKVINRNKVIQYLDMSNNQMNPKYEFYVEQACKGNRAQNLKDQAPKFIESVKKMKQVTSYSKDVEKRIGKLKIKSQQVSQKYESNRNHYSQLKSESQNSAKYWQQDVANIEKIQDKVSKQLENQERNHQAKQREMQQKARTTRDLLTKLSSNNKGTYQRIKEQEDILENKILSFKEDIRELKFELVDQQQKEQLKEKKYLELKQELRQFRNAPVGPQKDAETLKRSRNEQISSSSNTEEPISKKILEAQVQRQRAANLKQDKQQSPKKKRSPNRKFSIKKSRISNQQSSSSSKQSLSSSLSRKISPLKVQKTQSETGTPMSMRSPSRKLSSTPLLKNNKQQIAPE